MSDALIHAALQVRSAIHNAGPVPHYHWSIMERHRREWPTLWRALDELLKAAETPTFVVGVEENQG